MYHELLTFMELAIRLKRVRRQGWLDRGIHDPESSADHSWGVALLAWLLARDSDDLQHDRVMLLALVHDLPEALAGDATPFDTFRDETGVIPADHFSNPPTYDADAHDRKRDRERVALVEMLSHLPPDLADELHSAWEEYERAETPEARFVKQIDKLETLVQAEAYVAAQPDLIIDSFRRGARRDVTDPALATLVDELLGSENGEHGDGRYAGDDGGQ